MSVEVMVLSEPKQKCF